jgi:hypothetical protein
VDWVIYFGLGLKINASKDIRRRLGQVLSRLGLKPKLLHWFILRGRRKRLSMRGLSFAVSRVKPNGGGEWVLDFDPDQGETSSEKTKEEVVLVISGGGDMIMGSGTAGSEEAAASSGKGAIFSPAKSMLWCGFLRPGFSSPPEEEAVQAPGPSKSSFSGEVLSVLDEAVPEMDLDLEPDLGSGLSEERREDSHHVHPSPEKGILRRGFLLQRSFGVVSESRRLCSSEERLPSSGSVKTLLGMDLDPASSKADAVSPVDSAAASGSSMMLVASVVRGNHFSFPPVLEDAPTFSVHAEVSSGSKSTIRREAIQLYRISRKKLEKRLLIACSIYFVDKGGDPRIQVQDVG